MALPLLGILGGLAARRVIAGLITGLVYAFRTRIGLIIVSAMVWLGISFATVKVAIDPAIDLLKAYAQAGYAGGPYASAAIGWLGVLNFDKALTMIISAVTVRHAVTAGRLFLFKRGFGAKP